MPSTFESALTVAERASPSMIAISPITSPGRTVARVRPPRVTFAVPEVMTTRCWPTSSSFIITAPGSYSTL
jgi:hypothetical protein